MNYQTARIIGAAYTALSNDRWSCRTYDAIRREAGDSTLSNGQIARALQYDDVEADFSCGGSYVELIGMSHGDAKVAGALFKALSDERYTVRTLSGIAGRAEVLVGDVLNLVGEHFEDLFVFKTRRSDGAQLIGFAD